jgi:hypothetical protein
MSDFALPIPDVLFEKLARRATELALEQQDKVPVTKAQLAKRYGVSERTIKTWREKGLPGHVNGKEVMYVPAETDEWWRQQPDREGRLQV